MEDAGSPDPGTAALFPVAAFDVGSPDLSYAADAIFYTDISRWPATDAGSAIPLKTTMVDSPDGAAVANWLAAEHGFLPGINVPVPTGPESVTDNDGAEVDDDEDNEGTIPYVNPANTSNPDAIFALNYLLDH